jgi:hypothetical protein
MAKAQADIRSLARAHTAAAVKCLAGVMNQKKAPAAARVSAAIGLMDRGWGKPSQSHQHSGAVAVVTITAEKLDGLSEDELATLEAALPVLTKLGIVGGDQAAEGQA